MLKNIKLFVLDLDGTLYFGDKVIDGAVELVNALRKKYKVVFYTNSSVKSLEQIHQKLNDMLITCSLTEIYSSSSGTIRFLKEQNINNIYLIGSDAFKKDLKKHGITVVNNLNAENLVVGLDLNFDYHKILIALSILQRGGKFIVCNEDKSFPIKNNVIWPGAGAMVGAISTAANKKFDFIVGKPNTYILDEIAKDYNVKYDQIIVVGDSYESDIQMAINNKSKAILIDENEMINTKDIITLNNLKELLKYIRREKWIL